jgi:SAM-dependent methyltransferase
MRDALRCCDVPALRMQRCAWSLLPRGRNTCAREVHRRCRSSTPRRVCAMTFDPYNRTHELNAAATSAIATRLERRGEDPFFVQRLDNYLDEMAADTMRLVLDVGGGTGGAARRLASRAHFHGRIVGVDRSAELIAMATDKAVQAGLADKVDFRVGDATSVGDLAGQFDAAIAHTLVSHVDAPPAVLKEIAGCVRPGGRLAVVDSDYASWVYGGANAAAGQALADAVISGIITAPHGMRTLPAHVQAIGLELIGTKSYVLAEIGTASFFVSSLATYPTLLPLAGVADAETVQRWVDSQLKNSADGTFLGSINFYTYLRRRPE